MTGARERVAQRHLCRERPYRRPQRVIFIEEVDPSGNGFTMGPD